MEQRREIFNDMQSFQVKFSEQTTHTETHYKWLLKVNFLSFLRYDFIIVGGGSAGCVLANRLSEIPHWKILLLEAGEDENEISDVPAVAAYLQKSNIDWKFQTEPQPTACLGLIGTN